MKTLFTQNLNNLLCLVKKRNMIEKLTKIVQWA